MWQIACEEPTRNAAAKSLQEIWQAILSGKNKWTRTLCDLKKLCGDYLKIFLEESWQNEMGRDSNDKVWFYEIRGKYGEIHLYSAKNNLLAVFIDSVIISNRVERRYKDILKLYLKTDEGDVFLFNPKNLKFVAKLIKARRKKQVSEEERHRLRKLSEKYGFKSGKHFYNGQTITA